VIVLLDFQRVDSFVFVLFCFG